MISQAHLNRWTRVGLACACVVVFSVRTSPSQAIAQVTERISVDKNGVQGNGWSGLSSSVSADGRYVAFYSEATNLVQGDINGFGDIFVRDRQTGATERVSVASDGAQANNSSSNASISASGRYVAFSSGATNLVTGDTNGVPDVFVHDRLTGITERVNVNYAGQQAVHGSSDAPSISGDGRYVAFSSGADNLVSGDANGAIDVFVRDRQVGVTQRVSDSMNAIQGNQDSGPSRISQDGRYVAFVSNASNLVPGDSNGARDAYVYDRQARTMERVSVASDGGQGNTFSDSVSISADGRYVAFVSWADNLVPDDTNGASDVFVRDRITGVTERVSVSSGSIQGNAATANPTLSSFDAHISSNGRFVVFSSYANNLVAGDSNDLVDVFVHDRLIGVTELASVSTDGAYGDGSSFAPGISGDGLHVAFQSYAQTFVSGDTNGVTDIFVRDRGSADRLVNISTRGAVVSAPGGLLNGGFIIGPSSNGSKQVLIRARGPSMSGAPLFVPGTLANPTMRLVSAGTTIAQNDNWQTTDPLCLSPAVACGDASQIMSIGKDPCQPNPGQTVAPPGCGQEAALLVTLPPGPYNVVVSGVGGTTGIALVEVFEVDSSSLSKLGNISTRGTLVTAPGGLLNGGFIISPSGSGTKQVLIRARGPSMSGAPFFVPGTLANPTMRLVSAGTTVAQNDNWQTTDPLCLSPATACGDATQIAATGKDPCVPNPRQTVAPPNCGQEAALLVTLPPGPYNVVVSGVGGTTGVALVEVFDLSP